MESFPARSSSRRNRLLLFGGITLTILLLITVFSPPSALPFPKNLPVPVCSMEHRLERTFRKHAEYYDLSPGGNANWSSVVPANGGFVVSKAPGGNGYEMAGVTMFHQLHCLQMIRAAFQELESGDATLRRRRRRQSDVGQPELARLPDQNHWVHCLDYLMQGILCAADDTIEPAHDSEHGRVVDGYGVNHICRDPDKLWHEVMGKNSKPGWSKEWQMIEER